MSLVLFDTTPFSAVFHNRPGVAQVLLPWIAGRQAATSMLAYGELIERLKGFSEYSSYRGGLCSLLRIVQPYALTYAVLERYADLRRQLRPPYGPGLIGDIATLIAATALVRGTAVVTTDHDFLRVPHLPVMLLDRQTLRIIRDTR